MVSSRPSGVGRAVAREGRGAVVPLQATMATTTRDEDVNILPTPEHPDAADVGRRA